MFYQLVRRVVRRDLPDQGSTPLHLAAMHNNQGAIYALLLAGANPVVRDDWGRYPFMLSTNRYIRNTLAIPALEEAITASDACQSEQEINRLIAEYAAQ